MYRIKKWILPDNNQLFVAKWIEQNNMFQDVKGILNYDICMNSLFISLKINKNWMKLKWIEFTQTVISIFNV